MNKAEEFDLIVVVGGPGGSTLAALVAMQNHRVLLLERERFPRHQIGESPAKARPSLAKKKKSSAKKARLKPSTPAKDNEAEKVSK